MFSHEKLHVYGRALDFAAQATVLSSSWQRFLEMAQSSAVKAAAHLDLCVVKKLLPQADLTSEKELLRRIGAMLARM